MATIQTATKLRVRTDSRNTRNTIDMIFMYVIIELGVCRGHCWGGGCGWEGVRGRWRGGRMRVREGGSDERMVRK